MPRKLFRKGQSGNPGGRPKDLIPFRQVATPEMGGFAQKSLLYHLKHRSEKMTIWYYDQVHGKPVQPIISDDRGSLDMNLTNLLGMKPKEFVQLMAVVSKELAKKK